MKTKQIQHFTNIIGFRKWLIESPSKINKITGLEIQHKKWGQGIIVESIPNQDGRADILLIKFDGNDIPKKLSIGSLKPSFITYIDIPGNLVSEIETFLEDKKEQQHQERVQKTLKANEELIGRMKREQEARQKRAEQVKDNHKEFLKEKGISYEGVDKNPGKKIRITHCWRCKRHLDSRGFFICKTCGWIICDCGACGCGYDGGRRGKAY